MKAADVDHLYFDGTHYDLQYSDFPKDIPFWIHHGKKYGGSILELACGTGRVAIPLAKEGFEVTGLDVSQSMLGQAKKKALAAGVPVEWVHADCRDFDLERQFGLIIFPFNSMSHLYELEDVEFCLSCVRKHLKVEGRFIIDIFNPRLDILLRDATKRYPHTTYPNPEGEGLVEVTENNKYEDATQINRIKLYYDIAGRSHTEELNMRIFYPQEIDAILKYNGFIIEDKFGDYDGSGFKSGSPKQIIVCSTA